MTTKRATGFLAAVDRRPWVRLVAMLLVGVGTTILAHWAVQTVAPTTEEPAVTSSNESLGMHCSPRGKRYCHYDFQPRAVTAAGATVELPGSDGIPTGQPIRIVRSGVGGQIVALRYPDEMIDLRTGSDAWVKSGLAGLLIVVGLPLGIRGMRRSPVPPSAMLMIGALITGGFLFAPDDTAASGPPDAAPSAMQGYADPPTEPAIDPELSSHRVGSIVGRGVEVPASIASNLTVLGPPVAGLPPGADAAAGPGFDVISVPVRATPGPYSGTYGPGQDYLPNLALLGDGVGNAVWLDGDRRCGAAPTLFPSHFQAPRDGHVCFAVAPGFRPRYLVLINDDVAIDLR